MTGCIKCHKELWIVRAGTVLGSESNDNFVCICFECVKKQNKKKF